MLRSDVDQFSGSADIASLNRKIYPHRDIVGP
jgi:hypothetical protein